MAKAKRENGREKEGYCGKVNVNERGGKESREWGMAMVDNVGEREGENGKKE